MLSVISMSITHQYASRERLGYRTCDTSRPDEIGLSKVPEVILAFWVIKVAATTLGETGGDALSMTMHLGYALSTAVFFTLFMVTVAAQVASKSFHPFLYWGVIVATTTAGTTMADFADRSLGIGYVGGSLVLLTILMTVLGLWRFSLGSVSANRIVSRKAEAFYWATILFSNTLGTALGDFFADNLFLAQLVLGWPEIQRPGSDFLLNRLPNLLFAPPAVPALLGPFRHEPSRTSARSPALARPTCKSSSGLWPNSSE